MSCITTYRNRVWKGVFESMIIKNTTLFEIK
jgi:hypothetical protein